MRGDVRVNDQRTTPATRVATPDLAPPIGEFEGVSKRFGGVRALREVSYAVPRGEVHALVGEIGSG